MLPLKLTIQGLYAFPDKPQVIDFERLTQAQLFGIFGATGSGKSSVLEAISYALYGETDRLNKNDRRNYNMLNLRANRLWIDFEFLGGQEEQEYYRFTAEIKRRKSNFSDTTPPRREAFMKKGEEWLPIETGSIVDILGLSYENFRRTVIIPQGKFQEFLSLGNTDRTRMLREIFRLERFELYEPVKKLIQENDTAITREETLLNQLTAATPEVLEAKEIMLGKHTKRHEEATGSLAGIEKEINRLDAQKELMVQLALKRAELERLKRRKQEIEDRSETVRRYEVARLAFAHLIQQRDSLSGELKQNREALATLQKQREETTEKLVKARRTHTHIKAEYDQREQLQSQADELNRLAKTRGIILKINELDGRLTEGSKMIAKVQEQLSQAQKSEEEANTSYRALREAAPDLEAILQAREWQSQFQKTKEEQSRLQQSLETERATFQQKQTQVEVLLKRHDIPAETKDPLKAFADLIEEKTASLTKATEAREQAHISEIAASLRPGDPCPVCGSTAHPHPHPASQMPESGIIQLQQSLNELRVDAGRIELLQPEAGLVQSRIATISKQLAAIADELHRQEETAPISPKLLEARLAAAKENSEALKASEAALDQARKDRSEAEEQLGKLSRFHQELSQERTGLQARLDAETGSYRFIDASQLMHHTSEQLEALAVEAIDKYNSLGSLFQKEQERIDALLASQNKQEGILQQSQDQQRTLMQKEATLVQNLQKAIQSSDFEELEVVESLLREGLDIAAEKLIIETWNQEYNRAQAAVEQAEAQSSAIAYDAEAHEAHKAKAAELRDEIREKLIEIGSLKQNIEGLKRQLEEKKAIRKRHRALMRRDDTLKLMRKLFTGSGFVNYVSAIYLRQLCQAANERFRKLTHNQLQLEPTEDNSFAVRDFLNDGQLRSHKTLSGGQVFQASLCLALALADQVQDRARSRQRFFFIDEGFGALDKNSLRLVFETLRALRKERRIVGVISHVEELQEDIDTYLHISNDGDQGSVVRPSWL